MDKILLPTFEYGQAKGGVARYIEAIKRTFPNQVEVLPINRAKLDHLVFTLLTKARRYKAIWIHHVLPLGTAAMIVKYLTGKPYVVFLHGLDFDLARRNPWKRWLTQRILTLADGLVTNSKALALEVQTFTNANRMPLVVYPVIEDEFRQLVEVSHKTAANTPGRLKWLLQLTLGQVKKSNPNIITEATKPKSVKLLTVGRLVERKGHLKVLQALQQIPEASYHIVGQGPMLETLKNAVVSLDLSSRVKISTAVTDAELPAVYAAADIFVMPTTKTETDREGFGIVYLEAQLFGLPVIATRQPGVDEAVRDGEGGLLILDSLDELVLAIRKLENPGLRAQLADRGRKRVEQEFTREQQMKVLVSLL
jgi:phosphatidylinositol alpha-1,6-mannosyltransferase